MRRKTHEEFVQQVYRLVGKEYSVLEEYINSRTKLLMRHNTCGYEYKTTPHNFLNNRRCVKCSSRARKTTEKFKQEVYDLVGNEYEVLGEYINADTNILLRHNKCNYEYKVKPYHFLGSGTRCPKCNGGMKKSIEDYQEEVYQLAGNDYTVVGKNKENLIMKHNLCNNTYEVKMGNFRQGRRCPACNKRGYSRGDFIKCSESRGKDNVCTLYTIKCFGNDEEFYKIGITTRNLKDRFDDSIKMPYQYEVVDVVEGTAEEIWNREKKVHKQLKEYRYQPKIEFKGNSECFKIGRMTLDELLKRT